MKSILIGLLFTSWTALSQPSTIDRGEPATDESQVQSLCLPISDARRLVADALKLRVADTLLQTLSARVVILQNDKASVENSYTNLLNLSEQKYETQKEITADFVRLADGWKEEANYYQKRYKKQRRQKGLLTAVTVGLIGLIIVK